MKTLHVLRHAEAERAGPGGLADHQRPLAPRGVRGARAMAARLRGQGVELVLCSPSQRTRQTLEELGNVLGDAEVCEEDGLYLASAGRLLRRLRQVADSVSSVLLVGHNPGAQELVLLLSADGRLRDRVEGRFPAGALATLRFEVSAWSDLQAAEGQLAAYVTPGELGV